MGAQQSTEAPPAPVIPENIKAPSEAEVIAAEKGAPGLKSSGAGTDDTDFLNTSVLERIAEAANSLKGNSESTAPTVPWPCHSR